jgi:hypothetical protein
VVQLLLWLQCGGGAQAKGRRVSRRQTDQAGEGSSVQGKGGGDWHGAESPDRHFCPLGDSDHGRRHLRSSWLGVERVEARMHQPQPHNTE